MAPDERDLVSQARAGDASSFGELVRLHQGRVFAILSRYERDAHLVEDLAQDTFLKAWHHLEQFDGRGVFGHWLARIATTTALDHLRRQKHRRQEMSLEDLGENAHEWLEGGDDRATLEARAAREILDHALRQLSPEDRVVLTLQEIEGLSVKEITARTGWSGIAVRVRAHRARARLKHVLTEMEKDEHERTENPKAV